MHESPMIEKWTIAMRFRLSYWLENRDQDTFIIRDTLCDPETEICSTKLGSTRLPFECNCKNGYIRAGANCVDVDECVDGSRCPSGHECKNTIGMHSIEVKLTSILYRTYISIK